MRHILSAVVLLITSVSFAAVKDRTWSSYPLTGMTCGNGDQYKIFVSPGKAKKVAIAFEGGGACWSHDSCFGLIKLTNLKAPKGVSEVGGIYSADPKESPIADATMVYFPYCTGDVFAGSHTATYEKSTVHHIGRKIVAEGIDYLLKNMNDLVTKSTDLVVYGASAGAIGAIVHVRDLDAAFGAIPNKYLLLDSPGLHFGDDFWLKFTNDLIADYSSALTDAGLRFDIKNGLIADIVPSICHDLSDWRVGTLQSTRDRIMSSVFGKISADDHALAVLGTNGIYELTKDKNDNCSAWVPSSNQHTFLDGAQSAPKAGTMTAVGFSFEVISASPQLNYK